MTPAIRLASEHDAASIQAIYRPVVIHTPISFELEPPAVEEMRQRIAKTLTQLPWLIAESDGQALGYAYASVYRARPAYQWSVEVSAYVDQRCHRSGIGRALYTSLFSILVLQGFYNAYAGITLPNPASVGLHEALGFQPVGLYRAAGFKHGAWHDVGWWQLSLRPLVVPPEPPLTLAAVCASPSWQAALDSGLPSIREHPAPTT